MDAALARPHQTFNGEESYPTPEAKAAVLMESIITRHPWVDGNKRAGLGLALLLLRKEDLRVQASQDELYTLTMAVAEGRLSAAEIEAWLAPRSIAG